MDDTLHQRFIPTDTGFAIQTWQDVSSFLRNNERMYAENQTNKNSSSWKKHSALGWHKASIPEGVLHQWMKEFQRERNLALPPRITDPEFKTYMYAKIRDPAWRKLRVDGRTD